MCRSGFGLEVSSEDGRLLDALSGGWTAAAVLAASRAKHTERSVRAVAAQAGDAPDPVGAILEELLVALGPDRTRLALVAPLGGCRGAQIEQIEHRPTGLLTGRVGPILVQVVGEQVPPVARDRRSLASACWT